MPRQECGCVLRIAENLPVVLGHIEVFDQFVGERFVFRGFHEQFKDMGRWRLEHHICPFSRRACKVPQLFFSFAVEGFIERDLEVMPGPLTRRIAMPGLLLVRRSNH